MVAFFISVPHAGEQIAPETEWLKNLDERILMCDVDRYVDELYRPVWEELQIPSIVTQWHRYVVDPNRKPDDVDEDSVRGSFNPSGTFPIGLHWSVTTQGHRLITKPMSVELHQKLLDQYYSPFHQQIENKFQQFRVLGASKIFHLDAHSMPSKGTEVHPDPGQMRAEIIVSDFNGQSCDPRFTELVLAAYEKAGFEVKKNWPYIGGGVTQRYGKPNAGQHTLQVEMNRAIYMDEVTKQRLPGAFENVQYKLKVALREVLKGLEVLSQE